MSRLQEIIKNMVELYVEYSDDDGKLSKEELMTMVDKEIECAEMKVRTSTYSLYMTHDGKSLTILLLLY